jgi:predicted nucleic acid-binding protein
VHTADAEVLGMLKAQLEREGTRLDDFDLAIAETAGD